MLTRRKFLLGLGGAVTGAAAGAAYARWSEPHWLQVSKREVRISPPSNSNTPLRLLHLSDFHASPVVSLDYIAASIASGIKLRPDLIVITGDFFTNHLEEPKRFAGILAALSATAPTFACLGNHDGGAWTRRAGGYPTTAEARALLREAGITCLHNDSQQIVVRDRAVRLIGLGDLWSGDCQPQLAFAKVPPMESALRLVLNHNPDAKGPLRAFAWDLMLAGHTHGGQLRLPFFGTPFAPVADKRFVEGLHRWENRWLHISRGVGNLHGLRFNCRPEVTLLTIA